MSETGVSHARALQLLQENFDAVAESESVPLAQALGRYLHQPVSARESIPSFDNAAVDGYALARATIREASGKPLPVRGRIAAGDTATPLTSGAACRIFTGAPIPLGADIIVMDEDVAEQGTDTDGAWIRIPAQAAEASGNIRRSGEDLKKDDVALDVGARLRPQDLAAAASMAMAVLECRRRVRMAVFSTGKELREPSEALARSSVSIPDSNRVLLFGLLQRLPVEVHDGGILPDDPDAIKSALQSSARENDLLITSGGAGRGEEDHLLHVLDDLGEILFRRVNIKPGRPLSVARLPSKNGVCGCIALPGNPVAVMVCFLLYGRPLLAWLGGGEALRPQRFELPARFSMKKKPGRREFQRGILQGGGVARFEEQGSGILRSLRIADGLIELDEEVTQVKEGDAVGFLPFSGMGIDS